MLKALLCEVLFLLIEYYDATLCNNELVGTMFLCNPKDFESHPKAIPSNCVKYRMGSFLPECPLRYAGWFMSSCI